MFNFRKTSCNHEKIIPNMVSGYCPDCGEYVENHWYITRCACCGVKQKATFRNGKISADTKFCRNCGGSSFAVEELDRIDIVNINYAVILKQVIQNKRQSFIQTWIEENAFLPMKLIASY
ncbi:MAG: hypothetical protein WCY19_08460 [Candidatus Gastranaerophilaceae bacterium]